ncbi:hypothetical protein FS842_006780, partial [Serendipita sp. 407]
MIPGARVFGFLRRDGNGAPPLFHDVHQLWGGQVILRAVITHYSFLARVFINTIALLGAFFLQYVDKGPTFLSQPLQPTIIPLIFSDYPYNHLTRVSTRSTSLYRRSCPVLPSLLRHNMSSVSLEHLVHLFKLHSFKTSGLFVQRQGTPMDLLYH